MNRNELIEYVLFHGTTLEIPNYVELTDSGETIKVKNKEEIVYNSRIVTFLDFCNMVKKGESCQKDLLNYLLENKPKPLESDRRNETFNRNKSRHSLLIRALVLISANNINDAIKELHSFDDLIRTYDIPKYTNMRLNTFEAMLWITYQYLTVL